MYKSVCMKIYENYKKAFFYLYAAACLAGRGWGAAGCASHDAAADTAAAAAVCCLMIDIIYIYVYDIIAKKLAYFRQEYLWGVELIISVENIIIRCEILVFHAKIRFVRGKLIICFENMIFVSKYDISRNELIH